MKDNALESKNISSEKNTASVSSLSTRGNFIEITIT